MPVRGTASADDRSCCELVPMPRPGAIAQVPLQELLEAAPDAMVLADGDGRIVLVNGQTEQLFGYASGELVGQPVEVLLPQALRQHHQRHRAAYAVHPSTRPMGTGGEFSALRHDGSTFPVEISLAPLRTGSGPLVVAAVRDVTARREAEQALRASEERFRMTLDTSPLGIALVALDGQWLRVNDSLCELFGYTRDELLTMTFSDLMGAGGGPSDLQVEVHATGHPARRERCFVGSDGAVLWVELTMSLVRGTQGEPLHFVAQFRDITEPRRQAAELERLALTDALTGLPNRTLLMDRAARLLTNLRRQPGTVTLQLLDLDRFKEVNDSLGHQAGDALLQEVSRRLIGLARATDTVARLGGDEFALLSSELGPGQSEVLAARVLETLARPVLLTSAHGDVESVSVTASIGISRSSSPTSGPHDLYREADLALYKAKDDGRARAASYDDGLMRSLDQRLTRERQLREALVEDGLVVAFQPIIALGSGAVIAYEALVRLKDPVTGELIAPKEFLTLAEETGLLPRIDLAVLNQSLDLLPSLPELTRIHVNVAAATLKDAQWNSRLLEELETGQLSGRICVELTEQGFMTASGAAATTLGVLRQRGVRVGLDDFGTGFSSLSYLQDLPVDFLKLDVSLVHGIGTRRKSATMVKALIPLAHALDLEVVAEGVTEASQRELLTSWGCDAAQGYLFGRAGGLPCA